MNNQIMVIDANDVRWVIDTVRTVSKIKKLTKYSQRHRGFSASFSIVLRHATY